MTSSYDPITIVPARHPLHSALLQFQNVCFTLALATDIAYWQTVNLMWLNFSTWLLFAGIVFAVLAAIVGALAGLFGARSRRRGRMVLRVILTVLLLCVAFLNNLVHSRDGWTAIMPMGLALSAITVVLIVLIAMAGRGAAARRFTGEFHA
jgi:uncharacterized membrane protein